MLSALPKDPPPAPETRSQRRNELADFLRSRRGRLSPADVGLPNSARRRTPGLRREEVAELAGVGATWYTWLEQARDIQPSDDVLGRLAGALRLNESEVKHLFALVGKSIPQKALALGLEVVPESLAHAVETSFKCAAVLLGRRWDVLACNQAARDLFPSLAATEALGCNWIHLILCGASSRRRVVQWEANARRLVAEFRLSVADALDSPWIQEMIDLLKADSLEFRRWWEEHDVRGITTSSFQLGDDPEAALGFERLVLMPADGEGLRLLLYMPRP